VIAALRETMLLMIWGVSGVFAPDRFFSENEMESNSASNGICN